MGYLPRYQRREAIEGVHQPALRLRAAGIRPECAALLGTGLEKAGLFRPLRQAVEHPRQQAAVGPFAEVRAAHAIDDVACLVDQDDVGRPAHEFHGEGLFRLLPELRARGQAQQRQALIRRLLDGDDARARQVLAQQHTEHRRRVRVLIALAREMQPRRADARRYQQPARARARVYAQQQEIPLRLLDLIYPRPLQLRRELAQQSCEAHGVKWHLRPP